MNPNFRKKFLTPVFPPGYELVKFVSGFSSEVVDNDSPVSKPFGFFS